MMKAIEQKVMDFIEKQHILVGTETVILALSGGSDSMALGHLMVECYPQYRYVAAHVHHGLRSDADKDEALVKRFAAEHGLGFRCTHLDIGTLAQERGQGIEETGREERYRFFRSLGGELILTAHHMDDQAETILLHLIRGCGAEGARGMLPRERDLGRPLLCCSKEELISYCHEKRISYHEDSTNYDTVYTRNKIRLEVLPKMTEINPAVSAALSRFGSLAGEDDRFLNEIAGKVFAANSCRKGKDLILTWPLKPEQDISVMRRVLRIAAGMWDIVPSYERIGALLALQTGKEISLSSSLVVMHTGESLLFTEKRPLHKAFSNDLSWDLNFPGETDIPALGWKITTSVCFEKRKADPEKSGVFGASLFENGLPQFRYRRQGDFAVLPNGNRKKLSDYFIDEKIPKHLRDSIPLLSIGSQILWVVGYRVFGSAREKGVIVEIEKMG